MELAKEVTTEIARTFNTKSLSTKTTTIRTMEFLPTTPDSDTRDIKLESVIAQVFEGQRNMTVDFNGKLDAVYTNLDNKFEALNTHMRNQETQVNQTNDAVRRQEALIKGNVKLDESVRSTLSLKMLFDRK